MDDSIIFPRIWRWRLLTWALLAAANTTAETEFEAATPAEPVRIQPSAYTPEGVPVFTNESIAQQPSPNRPKPKAVYRQLQQTCQFWRIKFRQNRSELSRLNMNSACRDASNFAKRHLNKTVTAHFAPYQPDLKPKKASSTVSFNGQLGGASDETCKQWRERKNTINRQLRAGYRESRGNRLRQQRRELSERLYKTC